MRTNDPGRLLPKVVSTFSGGLSEGGRLGIIVFDQAAAMPLKLTPVLDPEFVSRVHESLQHVDYFGEWTDLPEAIRMAIYELRQEGRPDARHVIVFLTDGIVDVPRGSRYDRLESSSWLRGELAQEARRNGIQIFGIAFTEAADLQLIQSVAETTGGEYHLVLTAEAIGGAFRAIYARLAATGQPLSSPVVQLTPGPRHDNLSHAAPSNPAAAQLHGRAPGDAKSPGTRWWPWLVAIAVISSGVLVRVIVAYRRSLAILIGANKSYSVGKVLATTIGRRAAALALSHDTVSFRHAVIRYRAGGYRLQDLSSTNGTYVRGTRVNGEVVLKHGDVIRFGSVELEFRHPVSSQGGTVLVGGETGHVPKSADGDSGYPKERSTLKMPGIEAGALPIAEGTELVDHPLRTSPPGTEYVDHPLRKTTDR